MGKSAEFVDYYELLEVSPNATRETIERVFRYLAKSCHPDSSANADVKRFSQLVVACEKLANPDSRAAYDVEYERQKQLVKQLIEETGHISADCSERHRLLSLFYAQRRRDRKQPGIGNATLETIMVLPSDILEFHLWYFREKGWIHREESGLLSITAAGVDQIEATVQVSESQKFKRLEFDPSSALNAIAFVETPAPVMAETTESVANEYQPVADVATFVMPETSQQVHTETVFGSCQS